MKTKRIIALLLSLLLILGSVFSLSSCLSAVKLLLDADLGASENEGGEGEREEGTENADNDQNKNNSSSDNVTGSGVPDYSNGELEFLPDRAENQEEADKLSTINRALLSTVVISTKFEVSDRIDLDGYYYDTQTRPDSSAGSGVIYKLDRAAGDAYIITNYHVVYHKNSITEDGISDDILIYLYGQELEDYAIKAKYIGGSMTYDIAVLKIENSEILKKSCAVEARLGDSDGVAVFDEVYAVGNPEAFGMSVTEGIVSVDSETLGMIGADGKTAISLRVMRVSAAINSGNSGGGLYDADGDLIGIVNAKRTGSDVDNIAYAIPINLARNLCDNIIYYCDGVLKTSVYRCLLGVTLAANVTGLTVDSETGKVIKSELVEIEEITETCIIADKIAVGDIITSITVDGVQKDVTRLHHVIDHMINARVGSVVSMTLQRGTETFDVTVTIPETAITQVQ